MVRSYTQYDYFNNVFSGLVVVKTLTLIDSMSKTYRKLSDRSKMVRSYTQSDYFNNVFSGLVIDSMVKLSE